MALRPRDYYSTPYCALTTTRASSVNTTARAHAQHARSRARQAQFAGWIQLHDFSAALLQGVGGGGASNTRGADAPAAHRLRRALQRTLQTSLLAESPPGSGHSDSSSSSSRSRRAVFSGDDANDGEHGGRVVAVEVEIDSATEAAPQWRSRGTTSGGGAVEVAAIVSFTCTVRADLSYYSSSSSSSSSFSSDAANDDEDFVVNSDFSDEVAPPAHVAVSEGKHSGGGGGGGDDAGGGGGGGYLAAAAAAAVVPFPKSAAEALRELRVVAPLQVRNTPWTWKNRSDVINCRVCMYVCVASSSSSSSSSSTAENSSSCSHGLPVALCCC